MSSSVRIDDKEKDSLILGRLSTQGLNNKLTAETQYSKNFTRQGVKPCLSLHYNRSNSFLFANATTIYQFKAKSILCF